MGLFSKIFGRSTARRQRQRELFEYWDGEKLRRGDPFRLWRALNNHSKMNLENAPLVDKGEEPETTIFVKAIAEVFNVKRWDGESGLTDWEMLRLLFDFSDFNIALKKNTSPMPISSPPTDSES